jgi:hypothetical protein
LAAVSQTPKNEKYKAQGVEYAEVREFPGPTRQSKKTKDPAIRFICIADATKDPNSAGYWMKLSWWNPQIEDVNTAVPYINQDAGVGSGGGGGVGVESAWDPNGDAGSGEDQEEAAEKDQEDQEDQDQDQEEEKDMLSTQVGSHEQAQACY